jgi:predicted permease
VTAFLAGVLPAIRFSQHGNFGDLRARTPSRSSTRSGLGGGRGLVVLQVAAAVVLLVDGGLLVRTLRNLTALDVGFRSEGVLTLSVQPLGAATRREREQAFGEVLSRVEGLPESRGATLSVLTPLSGRDPTGRVEVPGYQPRSDADLDVVPNYVSAGYFEAFGIRLEQGRSFTTWDDADAPRVAILGATPARFYFGSTNPLGARIVVDSAGTALTYEVIGVAADVKHRTLREEPQRSVYLPIWQAPEGASRLTLSIRAAGSPVAMIDRVREEIRRAGGEILVSDVQTMDQQMDQALLGERLLSSLSTVLAALGVLLAAIGLYGLASHAVVRRTTEMGIRMALGAPGDTIRWIMLRDTAGMVCIGVAVGLPLSLLGGWALRNRLFGVSPADPATLVVCAAILGAVAGLAAYLPARRASRIDPVLTLNGD